MRADRLSILGGATLAVALTAFSGAALAERPFDHKMFWFKGRHGPAVADGRVSVGPSAGGPNSIPLPSIDTPPTDVRVPSANPGTGQDQE